MKSSSLVTLILTLFFMGIDVPHSFSQTTISEPKIIGHRGLMHEAPENTLTAFSTCIKLQIGIELDIRRTKDGALIILHDDTLNRTTNGKGNVSDLTLQELKNLDAGTWFHPTFRNEKVPTLEEFFILLKASGNKSTMVAIDLKITDATIEKEIIDLANKHQVLPQLVFIGLAISDLEIRKKLKLADANAHIAMLANKLENLEPALNDVHSDWVYVRFIPTAEEVKKIHNRGKKVFLVGMLVAGKEPKNWQLGKDAGINALLTDHPFECRNTWRANTKKEQQ
ncbi:MAG: glycerophosphodiester phosphodiesterase [Gemmataceae bacterium]